MLQSKLFAPTQKDITKEETSRNAQLLIRAGYVDKLMAGVYSFLPLGWRVMKKIENIIREEMNTIGGQELFLPTMGPKARWQKTNRWNDLSDILYKFKNGQEFALNPTHEEVIVPIAKKQIKSYKDLPLYVYQIQNKFRNEPRARSGLIRLREFIMKDLYSFHADEKDFDEYYQKAAQAYKNIYARVGIADVTYYTYAGGGTFSKFSHEFQTVAEAGEDTVSICKKCRVAINKEIIHVHKTCPQCGNAKLETSRSVEVGNIFPLKTKYSQAFNLAYRNKNDEEKFPIIGCYGIGLARLMATVVEVLSDNDGIRWPESIAPFQMHLLELGNNNPEVTASAQETYRQLQKNSIEVLYDDRQRNPGEKLVEADLLGMPWRVVISGKTVPRKTLEVKRRDDKEATYLTVSQLIQKLK